MHLLAQVMGLQFHKNTIIANYIEFKKNQACVSTH